MLSPVELEIELFCHGVRIDERATSTRTGGASPGRAPASARASSS